MSSLLTHALMATLGCEAVGTKLLKNNRKVVECLKQYSADNWLSNMVNTSELSLTYRKAAKSENC